MYAENKKSIFCFLTIENPLQLLIAHFKNMRAKEFQDLKKLDASLLSLAQMQNSLFAFFFWKKKYYSPVMLPLLQQF